MNTFIHFNNISLIYSYNEKFFRWEMFHTIAVQQTKTYILCSLTFFRKSCHLLDNVVKVGTAEQATDGDTAISKTTHKHTLTHTQDM
jgi:hypothetical protein